MFVNFIILFALLRTEVANAKVVYSCEGGIPQAQPGWAASSAI